MIKEFTVEDKKDDIKIVKFFNRGIFILFMINIYDFFSMFSISTEIVALILKSILIIQFLFIIRIILRRLDMKCLIFTILIILLFLISFLVESKNPYLKDYFIYFFTLCYPLGLSIYCIKNIELLTEYFEKNIYYSFFITCIFFIIATILEITIPPENQYSMSFSYSCATYCIFAYFLYKKKKRKLNLIISLLFLIIIVNYGARGALVTVLFYILTVNFIEIFLYSKDPKKVILFSFFIILIIGIYKFGLPILVDFLYNHNIESRTLYLLANDSMHTSGRDKIFTFLLNGRNGVFNQLLSFRGIAADRMKVGTYSHNIFIELIYSFGMIFGILLSFCIVFAIIYQIFILNRNASYKDVVIIFVSIGFIPLLFSNTLWHSFYFWCWILLSLKLFCGKKLKN